LRCAFLRSNPLGPGFGKQLYIDLEVVEDASIIQRPGLDITLASHHDRTNELSTYLDNALAWESRSLAPHGRTTVTTTSNQTHIAERRFIHIPEIGDDLVAAIGHLLVLLRRALSDLETILRVDCVTGVRAASDLAAIGAVAENLGALLATSSLRFGVRTAASLSPCTS
jgi:hypothetical protein